MILKSTFGENLVPLPRFSSPANSGQILFFVDAPNCTSKFLRARYIVYCYCLLTCTYRMLCLELSLCYCAAPVLSMGNGTPPRPLKHAAYSKAFLLGVHIRNCLFSPSSPWKYTSWWSSGNCAQCFSRGGKARRKMFSQQSSWSASTWASVSGRTSRGIDCLRWLAQWPVCCIFARCWLHGSRLAINVGGVVPYNTWKKAKKIILKVKMF